jgi:hypothetical protein
MFWALVQDPLQPKKITGKYRRNGGKIKQKMAGNTITKWREIEKENDGKTTE